MVRRVSVFLSVSASLFPSLPIALPLSLLLLLLLLFSLPPLPPSLPPNLSVCLSVCLSFSSLPPSTSLSLLILPLPLPLTRPVHKGLATNIPSAVAADAVVAAERPSAAARQAWSRWTAVNLPMSAGRDNCMDSSVAAADGDALAVPDVDETRRLASISGAQKAATFPAL